MSIVESEPTVVWELGDLYRRLLSGPDADYRETWRAFATNARYLRELQAAALGVVRAAALAPAPPQRRPRPSLSGTYKSFPVQDDDHFYTVARYVERNGLRAKLARRAEQWPWGSLAQRAGKQGVDDPPELSA